MAEYTLAIPAVKKEIVAGDRVDVKISDKDDLKKLIVIRVPANAGEEWIFASGIDDCLYYVRKFEYIRYNDI